MSIDIEDDDLNQARIYFTVSELEKKEFKAACDLEGLSMTNVCAKFAVSYTDKRRDALRLLDAGLKLKK